MTKILQSINDAVWGAPALILILGVGVYLSVRTGFAQLRLFPQALQTFLAKFMDKDKAQNGTSAFQALCTALAATVGTGNLAGVAGAIAIGGPGAIFWMWICGILGMVTKYAEATLAVRYRGKNARGEYVGGPMYMIRQGLGKRWAWLGGVYSFFGVIAAFGVGNATQVNAVVSSANQALESLGGQPSSRGNLLMGIALGIIVAIMLLGGAKRIGETAERLVPFAAGVYLVLGAGVLILRWERIPAALVSIVYGAFSPRAVTGGMIGSAFRSLRVGVSRGVFTNEAGMGTASIAHAAARVKHPAEQGLMGIMEVFLDTIVICTMTALVILCSDVPIAYGEDVGAALTAQAFSAVYGDWVSVVLALELCCFAFATILGWGLYGARCAQYLLGDQAWRFFAVLQSAMVVLGAVLKTDTVWTLSEIFNGLMAIPNLIALAVLAPELTRLTKEYKTMLGSKAANGGKYADFYQRKPLRTLSYAEVPSPGSAGKRAGEKDLSSEHRTA